MEKMVNNRLVWFLEKRNVLPDQQNIFRKGRSCADNLTRLTTFIQNSFYRKENFAAVFLDIKGVFSSVVYDILLKDLMSLDLPHKFIIFVKNLICISGLSYLSIQAKKENTKVTLASLRVYALARYYMFCTH